MSGPYNYFRMEITKKSPSFSRSWSFLSCLGTSLVQTRRLRIATMDCHRSPSLLLASLLLPLPRHPAWTMFGAATCMMTRKVIATTLAPSLLLGGKNFGLSSTVILIYSRRGISSRFLVPSMVYCNGLSFVCPRVDRHLLPRRVINVPHKEIEVPDDKDY